MKRWSMTLAAVIWAGTGLNDGWAYHLLENAPRWPTAETIFHVDLPHPDGAWNNAFDSAAAAWTNSTVFAARVAREGSNPCAGYSVSPSDSRNGVGFPSNVCGVAWPSKALGVALVLFEAASRRIVQTDILFNPAVNWAVYGGPWQDGVADFRRVVVHELGHSIGLDDEEHGNSIMHPVIRPGDSNEFPQQDDINGVSALYHPIGAPGCYHFYSLMADTAGFASVLAISDLGQGSRIEVNSVAAGGTLPNARVFSLGPRQTLFVGPGDVVCQGTLCSVYVRDVVPGAPFASELFVLGGSDLTAVPSHQFCY